MHTQTFAMGLLTTALLCLLQFDLTKMVNVNPNLRRCIESWNESSDFRSQLMQLRNSLHPMDFNARSFGPNLVANSRCNRRAIATPVFQNERSLCPWEIAEDYDENRYPQLLHYARCKCRYCQGGIRFECMPLSYRIPIIERQCNNGVFEYVKTFADLPVGCTCSRPYSIEM